MVQSGEDDDKAQPSLLVGPRPVQRGSLTRNRPDAHCSDTSNLVHAASTVQFDKSNRCRAQPGSVVHRERNQLQLQRVDRQNHRSRNSSPGPVADLNAR